MKIGRIQKQLIASVRYTSVELKPPGQLNQLKLSPVTLKVILVQVENPASGVDAPIEWLLLTQTAVDSCDDADQLIQ